MRSGWWDCCSDRWCCCTPSSWSMSITLAKRLEATEALNPCRGFPFACRAISPTSPWAHRPYPDAMATTIAGSAPRALDPAAARVPSASLARVSPLATLLTPRSIAVIGASRTPRTMGNQVMRNLTQQGFTGPVYPVNPRARSVCSVRAYPNIADIPEPVDLAVIVVPKEHVAQVAAECGA